MAAHLALMKLNLFLLVSALAFLSSCSGFQPVKLEHDSDKVKLDYREGDWMPKNS
jgi:hypothetical protein